MGRLREVAVAAAVTALALTTACGSDSSADESPSSGTHSVSGVLGGTVEGVPDDPQRVVGLWNASTQLLELGITPVGVLEGEFYEERLTAEQWDEVSDVPTVGTFDNRDIEKIASLEPDLIVGLSNGFMTEKDLEPFEKLGIPTLIWEIAEPPDVWANYPKFAAALGKSTDFEKRDAALDKQLADLEADFGDKLDGTVWANVRGGVDSNQFTVDTDQSLVYERLSAAGVEFPSFLTNLGEDARYALELSYEKLPRLSKADAFFYEAGPDGTPAETSAQLLEQDIFKQLPAVKARNAFPLSQQFNYTFEGQERMIEDIRAAFEKYEPTD